MAGDITISLSCAYVLFGVPDDGSISTGRVNEDAECRFQQLSGSVHKVGMVLDSVQTDVIQLNRTMKDASVECKPCKPALLIIIGIAAASALLMTFCTPVLSSLPTGTSH